MPAFQGHWGKTITRAPFHLTMKIADLFTMQSINLLWMQLHLASTLGVTSSRGTVLYKKPGLLELSAHMKIRQLTGMRTQLYRRLGYLFFLKFEQ